ncbi:hypothetical protein HYFRA_00002944 [Hymenoscyphus fraxineus]|uniref:BHLH domain-containing protein n=1 Tax=Hymenoscyphus fraxineus TaxID=746836 RepID=A0A9N9KPI6_9HELO|nr:hypothetical protein HYFRA_00002944 [Hymenoscyphus fraxineus]
MSKATVDPAALTGYGIDDFSDPVSFVDVDTLDQEPLFAADWDQPQPAMETPPYDDGNLYSTPLNWDPPEAKIEPLYAGQYTNHTMNTLTPEVREKLRNIAMPSHLQYRGHHSPNSTASYKSNSNSASSPETNGSNSSRKRKSSASGDDEDEDPAEGHPPVKKTAHNMIEKRYRTNLNDKIAALRDSVPSLRIMTKSARGEDTADDREELQGLTPAHKLNKATVLSKATEYIQFLERKNKKLQAENELQKARIAAFETLFHSGSFPSNPHPHPQMTNQFQYPRDYNTPGHSPTGDPQGMIPVPENIQRLNAQANRQAPYPVPQQQFNQNRQPVGQNGWQTGGGYFGKLMVGSLAGLMLMEGFAETEQTTATPGGRGLSALPFQLIGTLSKSLYSSMDVRLLGYHVSAAQSLQYMKIFLVIGAFVTIVLPSMSTRTSRVKNDKTKPAELSAAPSLASPIHLRRQAWLTAIQTVWVPRHNFFLEAAALCLKIAKLSIRNFIGSEGYAYLTGITLQEEAARVKAWEIALDAQLAGGDVEVSKSRLTLTLLASGTLPDTPARLMLKALHIRVLLWEVGNAGFNGFYMFHEIAAKMARWKWNEAKTMHRILIQTKEKPDGHFPEYLQALLEEECDDVLNDCIGQRAYNLAWNLPTTFNVLGSSDGMNGVTDDSAIRSPLDAVAAWYSSLVLQRALAKSLDTKTAVDKTHITIAEDIALAIKVAPTGSRSHSQALVAQALLVQDNRKENFKNAVRILSPFKAKDAKNATSTLIDSASTVSSLPDIRMTLRCAEAITCLDEFPSPQNPVGAHPTINAIAPTIVPANLSLLSFTAAFHLMEKLHAHEKMAVSCSMTLEKLAGSLRIWIGGPYGEKSGLEKSVKKDMVERCLTITKHVLGMEKDAGYESMSEGDTSEGC